jgi:hypothetical protein
LARRRTTPPPTNQRSARARADLRRAKGTQPPAKRPRGTKTKLELGLSHPDDYDALQRVSVAVRSRLTPFAELEDEFPPPGTICEHARNPLLGGYCKLPAACLKVIPDGYCPISPSDEKPIKYIPWRRRSPYVARTVEPACLPPIGTKIPVCRQHRGMIEYYAKHGTYLDGRSHQLHCDVCRHPESEWVAEQWVRWRLGSEEAQRLLGVPQITWYRHVCALGLDELRRKKDGRKQYLQRAMEKGMDAGGHTIHSGLKAAAQLAREEGDMPAEQIDHNLTAIIGVADITKLSNVDLAAHLERIATSLRSAEKALTNGNGGRPAITLPKDAVRVRPNDSDFEGDGEDD